MGPLLTSGWFSRVSITFSRRQHGALELLHVYAGAVNDLLQRCWWPGRRVSSPKSAFLGFRHSSRALLARPCSLGTLGTRHRSRGTVPCGRRVRSQLPPP